MGPATRRLPAPGNLWAARRQFKQKHQRRKQRPDKGKWPKGVRGVSFDELDNLGMDADKNLYWDGERLHTSSRVNLTLWQRIGAVVTVLSAAAVALFAALTYFLK